MGRRTIAALVVLSAAIAGREVAAEDGLAHAWHGRTMLIFNVGMHAAPASFDYKDAYPILDGGATAAARFKGKVSSTYDIGAAVRLADNFGIGASLTRYSEELVVSSSLTLPHPIFRNRMVSASLDGPGHREESTLHLYALYVVPMKGRVQLGLFAGPSRFDFAQELVRDFEGDVDFGPDFDLELKLYDL
jgi:hypothetical protein